MALTSVFPPAAWRRALFCLLALGVLANQALADEDDDEGFSPGPDWAPVITLPLGEAVSDVFPFMARVPGPGAGCAGPPLLEPPLPEPGQWACARLENAGATPGIWRVDFEGLSGAGYRFELVDGPNRHVILATPGAADTAVTAQGRMASLPIVVPPGGAQDLYMQVATPEDLLDADPVLRTEASFDDARRSHASGVGVLLGASALLLGLFAAMARLLQSQPAQRYALYFAAAMLAVASQEGALGWVVPGAAGLVSGAFDKAVEAAQISAHFFFLAAFLRASAAGSGAVLWLQRMGWLALVLLMGTLAASFALAGPDDLVRYFDLGFELDPLLEDPFGSWPIALGALVSACWLGAVLAVAGLLLRLRAQGSGLFLLGAVILVGGLLFASFSEEILDGASDDTLLRPFILLADGVVFAGAMLLQTFGLRDERDRALRQELAATQEKVRTAQLLADTRQNLDRARTLAEQHRSRLALTGHDLRQPLTSLRLALTRAEERDPDLGRALRPSVEYLQDVLNDAVAETRPDADLQAQAGDEGGFHTAAPQTEPVAVEILFANAVRMFASEAEAKGLGLRYEPTDLTVDTTPVTVIRILSNLVSNAVKYTEAGEVVLRAHHTDQRVTLEVCDTGPGLTDAEIETILQAYQRGADVDHVAGDGLGLASVQDVAASMGAALAIRSTPGRGTCFALEGVRHGGAVADPD